MCFAVLPRLSLPSLAIFCRSRVRIQRLAQLFDLGGGNSVGPGDLMPGGHTDRRFASGRLHHFQRTKVPIAGEVTAACHKSAPCAQGNRGNQRIDQVSGRNFIHHTLACWAHVMSRVIAPIYCNGLEYRAAGRPGRPIVN